MANLVENSLLAIDVEDVFGTYEEDSQVAIPVQTITPSNSVNLIERMDEKTGSYFEQVPVTGQEDHALTFAMRAYPGDQLGFLINSLLGAASSSDAGTTEYKHVFTLSDSNVLQRSLSAEITEAGLTADDYDGGYITSLTINGDNEGHVTLEVEMGFQSRTSGTEMSPITLPSIVPFKSSMAKLYYNSSEVECDSWSININPNIVYPNHKSGDKETKAPVIAGRPDVRVTMEFDNSDRTFRTAYEAVTSNQFKMVATHTENINGAVPYLFSIEFPESVIMEVPELSGDSGPAKESVTLKAYEGTSEEGNSTSMEVIVQNATATYTARP